MKQRHKEGHKNRNIKLRDNETDITGEMKREKRVKQREKVSGDIPATWFMF